MQVIMDTVRGGQTTIHNIRMGWQVYRKLFITLPICIVSAFIAYELWGNASPMNWKLGGSYARVYLSNQMPWYNPNTKYSLNLGRGSNEVFTADRIWHDPAFKKNAYHLIGIAEEGAKKGALASLGCATLILAYYLIRGRQLRGRRHLRGGQIVDAKKLKKLTDKTYSWVDRFAGTPRYKLAGITFPNGAETMHTLVTGTTGAGKTVAIMELLDQIRARGDKAIIYDKMDSFTKAFYDSKRDVILNPFDDRAHNWRIFNDATAPHQFDMIANALIPQFKDTADPFWTDTARNLFSSAAEKLYERGDKSNEKLLETLMRVDLGELAKMLHGSVSQAIIDPSNTKTAASVRTVLTTSLKYLRYVPDGGKQFSISKWVRDADDSFLFLSSSASIHASMKALIATWVEIAVVELLSLKRSKNRRVWFIIDEVPTLEKIPSLLSLLCESRQFGGCAVIGTQMVSHLRSIYGRDDTETISGNCSSRLVGATPDAETSEWLSKSLGKHEEKLMNQGVSFGANPIRDGVNFTQREEAKPLVMPSEIQNLAPLQYYLKMPFALPITKVKLKVKNRPQLDKVETPHKSRLIDIPIHWLRTCWERVKQGFKQKHSKDDADMNKPSSEIADADEKQATEADAKASNANKKNERQDEAVKSSSDNKEKATDKTNHQLATEPELPLVGDVNVTTVTPKQDVLRKRNLVTSENFTREAFRISSEMQSPEKYADVLAALTVDESGIIDLGAGIFDETPKPPEENYNREGALRECEAFVGMFDEENVPNDEGKDKRGDI